mgnify:CR=1 FL=1
MPDPKSKQAEDTEAATSKEDSAKEELSEADQLRQELGVFKGRFEETQQELTDFRNRYDEREDQFRRDFSRQGQELGERVKHLQDLVGRVIQPADETKQTGKRKRSVVVQIPDNITAQDDFLKFQQGLVEQVSGLEDELTELRSAGGQSEGLKAELKKLQEELNLVRYESFVAKEEALMRSDYGLDDRDLRKVRDYMKDSGIYSMEAAAIKVPGIKEKMFESYAKRSDQTNGHDEEEAEERPRKKSRYSAEQVGKEMLKTKPDESVPKGGAKRVEGDLGWEQEMIDALNDGSFFKWPKTKQDEYEQKAAKRASEKQERRYY